jgi:protein-S-isoprenylcysteine O-methyltransferase Ste14
MSVAFWLILLNILSFIISFLLLTRPNWKTSYDRLPRIVQKSLVLFNVAPLLLLPFASQARLDWQWSYLPAGVILIASGVVFWVLAMRQIGAIPSMKAKSRVVSNSVYRIVRHPIYLGTILVTVGLALATRGIVSLIYTLFVAVFYSLLISAEEKSLLAEYGEEYQSYQRRVTRRLIPFLF